eukprot:m.171721 g.171721  ORF g.171721 m.171721 type:complete len:359 (-) comp17848_c0_seq3:2349-3425(-)
MYGEIPELEKQLATSEAEEPATRMIGDAVTAADIAEVVSRKTGIPVHNMLQSEKEKLLHMEELLRTRVVGQEAALQAVSDAVRLNRAGLSSENRPIASFMFLGPTGVGKTELVKAISQFMFDSESALVRVDMSEFMERFSVSRLVGAPPGYVGYEEGGILTEAVRRRPFTVVLLDEFEKAHREVANLMLQVLDEGKLTDSQGRTVDFTNTIVIMTSNLGAQQLATSGMDPSDCRAEILSLVRDHFSPEFVNRIDEFVLFNRLKKEDMDGILSIRLRELQTRLDHQRISLELTNNARQWLCERGFEPAFGARPLNRVLHKDLMNPLAAKILDGSVPTDCTVHVDAAADGNKLVLTTAAA